MARKPQSRTRTGPRRPARPAAGRMRAPKSGVIVRMYRLGHGDCFLLAFRGARGKPVYVLIDCGFKPGSNGPDYQLPTIEQVVDDIKAATGRRLDLVIVTHEHEDHVNGFWQPDAPYFADFEIGAAWFAWTGDPEDALANELRRRHGDQLLGALAARNRLAAAGADAAAARVDDLLCFELGVEPARFRAEATARKNDPRAAVNQQGIKLIKDKAGSRNTRYIIPHQEIMRIPGVDDVRVFALGPPHRADLLADADPQGAGSFPSQAVGARVSFLAAAAASDGRGAQQIQPFAQRFSRPIGEAFDDPEHGAFLSARYGMAADAAQADLGAESASDAAWRRIDHDWLHSAEALALDINRAINNTSLVLAFELPESKKVLLFVGDAQRGNWRSWTEGSWRDGDGTITVRDLLARTVLYKVGHHGSHGATLLGTEQDDHPNLSWMGHGKYRGEFAAMITAVGKWAQSIPKPPWVHPLPSIKAALNGKCGGRVFQTDTAELAAPQAPDAGWDDFMRRTRTSDLYFEYEVHDR